MVPPAAPTPATGRDKPPTGRVWLLRLLLVVAAPLVFFGGIEGGLRLAGIGPPTDLFIPDETAGFYRTNPDFTHPFIPAQFDIQPLNFRLAKQKAPGSYRVFILGESATQGVPEPGFGFVAQLRAQLRARYPGKPIEVYNLGITAINSHVVYQMAREVMAFAPDLLVVYLGNNEVVGPYGPGCVYQAAMPPLWAIRASVQVRRTRAGALLGRALGRLRNRGRNAAEWRGMETFAETTVRADDPRLPKAYANFEANLRGITTLAARTGVKTVLATVVANLKDCPPFVSLHRAGLSGEDERACEAAFKAGLLAWRLGDWGEARGRLEEARRLDPEYANTHYVLGALATGRNDHDEARQRYLAALHWDALRFRPDERINEIVRATAHAGGPGVSLVDLAGELGSDAGSRGPVSGREILFEHVHFDWEGNFQVGRRLAEAAAVALFPGETPGAEWPDATQCAKALGYTAHGRQNSLALMAALTGRPPFTGQLTFAEDQARLRQELALARRQLATPGARAEAASALEAALRDDPQNDRLSMELEALEVERGNFARALGLLDHLRIIQPVSPVTITSRAEVLLRLERYAEAEAVLLPQALSSPRLFEAGCGLLVRIWAKTGRFEPGQRCFDAVLAKNPTGQRIRLERGNLFLRQGDARGAERQWRMILAENPGNEAALEELVNLLQHEHRPEAAIELAFEAARRQPGNFRNNLRLAEAFARKNDAPKTLEFLLAAAASGPTKVPLHLELASRLHAAGRPGEALDHLALARRIAQAEGLAEQAREIEQLIRAGRATQ